MVASSSLHEAATSPDLSVSVALATYNGERFLQRQLDTIAQQTIRPSELVVTDDRSTDGTVGILEAYRSTAPFPVRIVINEERLGFQRNFRKAIQLCASELIFFCDQDDVWLPNKVEAMCEAFAAPRTLLAYHNAAVVDVAENGIGHMHVAADQPGILAQQPLHPWHVINGLAQVMRSGLREFDDLWDQSLNHTHDDILSHDQWYIFLALVLGEVRYVDQDLVLYRQHGQNTVGAERQQTRWQRQLRRFIHHADTDARKAAAAVKRAHILKQIASRVPAAQHERVLGIAAQYQVMAGRLDRRYATYARTSIFARLVSLGASMLAGDYCGNPWAFDWRSIPRDLVTGVIRGGGNAG